MPQVGRASARLGKVSTSEWRAEARPTSIMLFRRLRSLFRKEKLDAEMSEEMRLHLERRTDENIAAGMTPEEARYAALRKFGGVEQAKELARDNRGWMWLDHLARDTRHGWR